MRNHADLRRELSQQNIDELTRRLLAYAAYRGMTEPKERVIRAIRDAAEGKHPHFYRNRPSLFTFLCLVIEGR